MFLSCSSRRSLIVTYEEYTKRCLFAIALKVHSSWILRAQIIRDRLLLFEEKSGVNKLALVLLIKNKVWLLRV